MQEIYYGHRYDNGFRHVYSRRYSVEFCFIDKPIVSLSASEDPNGEYYGWLENKSTNYSLIQPNELTFSMQFPGNPYELKSGRVVRLSITQIEEKDDELCNTVSI